MVEVKCCIVVDFVVEREGVEVEESVDGVDEAEESDVEALLFIVVIDAELIDVNGGSFSRFL